MKTAPPACPKEFAAGHDLRLLAERLDPRHFRALSLGIGLWDESRPARLKGARTVRQSLGQPPRATAGVPVPRVSDLRRPMPRKSQRQPKGSGAPFGQWARQLCGWALDFVLVAVCIGGVLFAVGRLAMPPGTTLLAAAGRFADLSPLAAALVHAPVWVPIVILWGLFIIYICGFRGIAGQTLGEIVIDRLLRRGVRPPPDTRAREGIVQLRG